MPPRLLSTALGLWLMAAPAALGYGGAAATSDRIAGPVAAALAFVALWEVLRGLRWGEALVGVWLLAAPWALAFPGRAAANSVVVGLALVVLATMGGAVSGRYGGGWRALLGRAPRRRAPEKALL